MKMVMLPIDPKIKDMGAPSVTLGVMAHSRCPKAASMISLKVGYWIMAPRFPPMICNAVGINIIALIIMPYIMANVGVINLDKEWCPLTVMIRHVKYI